MQSSISQQSFPAQNTLLSLLESVETLMLASIGVTSPQISRTKDAASEAAAYHLQAGGQRARTKIALQAALDIGLPPDDGIVIAATVELLHNASLVHDDIEDGDEYRRGQPAVWRKFGVNTAICTGDLLLSAAYATLCRLSNTQVLPLMLSLVHQRVSMAIDGQCADLSAGSITLVDSAAALRRYEQIATAKSGALLGLPLELALMAAGCQDYLSDAWEAAQAFAIGYQIVDDLQDLQADLCHASDHRYNIAAVFSASGSLAEAMEKSRQHGLEKIELTITQARRLPYNTGERLADIARTLRYTLSECKFKD